MPFNCCGIPFLGDKGEKIYMKGNCCLSKLIGQTHPVVSMRILSERVRR